MHVGSLGRRYSLAGSLYQVYLRVLEALGH
jgi:hypothetical protein